MNLTATPSAPPTERRRIQRITIELSGDCRPVATLRATWPIHTADISTGGLGLLTGRRFEPGTLLAVSFTRPNAPAVQMPLAVVRRACAVGLRWRLSCAWVAALNTDELTGLLEIRDELPPRRVPGKRPHIIRPAGFGWRALKR